jgi:pilus assembly protein CpaD
MIRTLLLSATALALVFSAAACSTPAGGKGPPPITPTERYSMKAEEHPEQIALAPHADGLSDGQRAALTKYAEGWLADGGGPIAISAPRDGGDPAARTAWAVKAKLHAMGVGDEDLRVEGYDADHAGAPVLIVYQRYQAVIPKCNESWTNLAATRKNDTQQNFGCAVTANMAAQIENPRDILHPRATEASDATRRETVLGKYRKGEVTGAKSEDPNAGKSSTVGQN